MGLVEVLPLFEVISKVGRHDAIALEVVEGG